MKLRTSLPFRSFIRLFVVGLLSALPRITMAQEGSPIKVTTILLPLQLDSLFEFDQYKFGNNLPRFVLPYLEFYNGVKLAVDSLNKNGTPAWIHIADTRQAGSSLTTILDNPTIKQSKLLIGVAQNSTELKQMTDFARQQNIPFVSATYPNDGGVRSSPQLFMANSSLRTHCMGIYKYLQQNHSTDKIVVVTRKGSVESYIKTWLEEAAGQTKSIQLPLKFVTLSDSFGTAQLQPLLDSNRRQVVLGATLDEAFSKRLVKTISGLQPKYQTLTMGMPTWDEIDFRKPEFKGTEVMYSTPFVSLTANVDVYNSLARQYALTQNSRPSDMALKGFEITYRFVSMLQRWPTLDSFTLHINDKTDKVFCDYNFQPVFTKGDNQGIHYYENKQLYFVKKVDGHVKGIY